MEIEKGKEEIINEVSPDGVFFDEVSPDLSVVTNNGSLEVLNPSSNIAPSSTTTPETAATPTVVYDTIVQIGEELDEIVDHSTSVEFKVPETPLFNAQTVSNEPQIDLNDLFQRPNFNRVDQNSESQSLSPQMLASIRKTGQFSVSSKFEGQENTWELSNLVQRGSVKTCEDFKNGVVFTVKQYCVHIPNRLWKGDYFTFWDGFKTFFLSLFSIPKLLFGFPQSYLSAPKIERERIRLSKLIDILTEKSYQNGNSNIVEEQNEIVTIDDMKIAIHNFKNIRDALAIPYENLKKNWSLNAPDRRSALVEKLSDNYSDDKELAQEVRDEEEKLFQEEVYKLIHNVLSPEEAKKVVSLMNSIAIIREALHAHQKRRNNAVSIYQKELVQKHSILGKIPEWVSDRVNSFTQRYDKKNPLDVTSLSEKLEAVEGYLFKKNLEIDDQVEKTFNDSRVKSPKKTWDWSFRIWRPSKWIITNQNEKNPERAPHYTVDKYKSYTTSSRFFGWRLGHIFVRFARNINNGLFGLISNLIYGPFGLRSLVGIEEFQPDKTIDSTTREFKSTGSKYTTWFGRIVALWKHISKSRTDFESAPNEGFFGKGFVRPFNLLWNYICKGVVGTGIVFFGHPLLSVLQTVISTALIVTSPVWSLAHALATYLCSIFIYDVDAPGNTVGLPFFQIFVWRCLLKGVGQMITTPLVAVGNALLGFLAITGSSLRWTGRTLWDLFIFNTFIRFQGRIPKRDGFLARRIKGPGLGMEYYQQITSDFALLRLQHQFEQELIRNYEKEQQEFINMPLKKLENYYAQFKELGLVTDYEGARIKKFKQTRDILLSKLQDAIRQHNEHLIVKGTPNFGYVRLSKNDLDFTLSEGQLLCTRFFKTFLQTLTENKAFWTSKNLMEYDFNGLTRHYLERAFSYAIFQPLEELDSSGFRIKIDHVGFREFGRMVWNSKPRDDLDKEIPLHNAINFGSLSKTLQFPSSNVIVVTPDNFDSNSKYETFVYLEQNHLKDQLRKQ